MARKRPVRRSGRQTRTPEAFLAGTQDASFNREMKKAISLSLAEQEDSTAPPEAKTATSSRKRPRKTEQASQEYLSAKQRRCKAPQRLMQELEEREFEERLSKALEVSREEPVRVKVEPNIEEPDVEASLKRPTKVKPERPGRVPSRPWNRPAGPQLKTETIKTKPERPQARKKKRSSIKFNSYKFDWTKAVPHRHYVGVSELYDRYVAFAWIRGRREVLGWFDSSVEAALAYDEAMTARYGENAEKNFMSFLDDNGNRLPEFARGVHR